jgi:hypothetical protein
VIKSVSGVIKGSVPTFDVIYWTGLVYFCESDKSSDQYLPTLEDVTEERTEELNWEALFLLDEQQASYNRLFLYKTQWTRKCTDNQRIKYEYTEGYKKMYSLFDSQYLWNKVTCSYNSCAVL